MQLGAVCVRTIDNEPVEFGTAGYTMNNVFVLYDRKTGSVWYPLTDSSFDAVNGPVKGLSLPFIAKPEVMRLHEWVAKHPDTLVLLPPPPTPEQIEAEARRARILAMLLGEWAMVTEFQGQEIDAVLTITRGEERIDATWSSLGTEAEVRDLRFNGRNLRFTRDMPNGPTLHFEGELADGTITGVWKSDMGELPCRGTRVKGPPEEEIPPASQPVDH